MLSPGFVCLLVSNISQNVLMDFFMKISWNVVSGGRKEWYYVKHFLSAFISCCFIAAFILPLITQTTLNWLVAVCYTNKFTLHCKTENLSEKHFWKMMAELGGISAVWISCVKIWGLDLDTTDLEKFGKMVAQRSLFLYAQNWWDLIKEELLF